MHVSFWEYDTFYKNIDYAIVGSGIVGLSTALEIKKKFPKSKVVVLERSTLPCGASTKNAGFACFGSPTELLADLSVMSEDEVFSTVKKRWDGLNNLKSILRTDKLGYEQYSGYELFTSQDQQVYEETVNRIDELNRLLKPIFKKEVYRVGNEQIKNFGLRDVKHIIANPFEGQVDTGKMMFNLIQKAQQDGIMLMNGVKVLAIEQVNNGAVLQLEKVDLKVKNAIVTTNGFAKQLIPEIDVEPARAQVLITEPIEGLKIKGTFHYQQGYYYFRNVGNRVLLGGGRNLAFERENTTEIGITKVIQNKLDHLLSTVILPEVSNIKIDRRWAGIMGVGSKKTTIVKQTNSNIYCGVRLGGMGVAIGSLIGTEIADLM